MTIPTDALVGGRGAACRADCQDVAAAEAASAAALRAAIAADGVMPEGGAAMLVVVPAA